MQECLESYSTMYVLVVIERGGTGDCFEINKCIIKSKIPICFGYFVVSLEACK